MAEVPGLNDFVGCKACHTDQRVGSDHIWQQIVDDPVAWAAGTAPDTVKYAYTANLMNDTHMSHAMEFEYPQSMSNCATCHAGHLAEITVDANFTPGDLQELPPGDTQHHHAGRPRARADDASRARPPPRRTTPPSTSTPPRPAACTGCQVGGLGKSFAASSTPATTR